MRYNGANTYIGEFDKDKIWGQGVMYWANTNDNYDGAFKDGLPDGFGTYKYGSGAIAEGQWLKGKLHGRGKMIEVDGGEYEGNFFDHMK